MTPQETAAEGLNLIKRAILAYSKERKTGLRQVDYARDLGLELGEHTFTRVLAREILRQLVEEKRLRVKRKGARKLYFPNQ